MAHIIDLNLTEAANYLLEKRLAKPYTDKSNQTDWEYRYGPRVIHRPNHGLAHSIRTALYIPLVADAWGYQFTAKNLKKMMIVRSFIFCGRENEAKRVNENSQYMKGRASSAEIFKQFLQEKMPHFFSPRDIAFYIKVIKGNDENSVKSDPRFKVISTCYTLDSLRSNPRIGFDQIIASFRLPKLLKLVERVERCLNATGNRIFGVMDYQPKLFLQCSTNVEFCINQVTKALYSEEEFIETGDQYFIEGKYDEALKEYLVAQKITILESTKAFLGIKIGCVYEQLGKYYEAKKIIQEAHLYYYRINDESIFYGHIGRLNEKLKINNAEDTLEFLMGIPKGSRNAMTHYYFAMLDDNPKDPKNFLGLTQKRHLIKSIELSDFTFDQACWKLAKILNVNERVTINGQSMDSIELYCKVIENLSSYNLLDVYNDLVIELERQNESIKLLGESLDVKKLYSKIIELDIGYKYINIYHKLALLMTPLESFQLKSETYTKTDLLIKYIQIAPNSALAHLLLAQQLNVLSILKGTLSINKTLNPNQESLIFQSLSSFSNSNRIFDLTVAMLQRAIGLDPHLAEAYHYLAKVTPKDILIIFPNGSSMTKAQLETKALEVETQKTSEQMFNF